jgi:hypothetical protein
VVIEGSDVPEGSVSSESSAEESFSGWLDFLRVVSSLVASDSVAGNRSGNLRPGSDAELGEDM